MQPNILKCLVVDDEPMALNLMESYVLRTPFLELKKKCDSAYEALRFLNEEQVDLVFLDIQMPELTGIELSRIIPKHTRIIFTTAFDKYAIDGFKVDALDYLLKPFNYAEFLVAANKAKEWFRLVEGYNEEKQLKKEYIFIRSEHKQIKLQLSSIQYIEGLADYVKIWTKESPKPILTLMSLKSFEQELPKDEFMRVHRSFIIAYKAINSVERGQIIINDKRITVSEQYKATFQQYLSNNSLD